MPELPEVETVRRGLAPVMEGARIDRVSLRRAGLRFPFPDRFAARLEGARVESLARRAKYLLAMLSTGETLIMHLGMSGRFVVERRDMDDEAGPDDHAPGRFHNQIQRLVAHDHVVFRLHPVAGHTLYNVIYNDPRRFGFMDLVAPGAESAHLVALGREPLDPGLDGPALRALFEGRRAPLKAALLDQRLIAGLGNIYVCEALHRAKLAPERPAGGLSAREAAGLAKVIRAVLEEAIAAGGSTLRDHAQVDGELGYFQHAFRVYGREGGPCPAPGCSGVVRRAVHAGRSTFYCDRCQR